MENEGQVIDFREKQELGILFPNTPIIKDFDSGELDTAKHPVAFAINNFNDDVSYGFKLTSHPQPQALNEFMYVTLKKGVDFKDSDKESSTIKCDHVVVFGEGLDNKYIMNYFSQRGSILPGRYNEIMTQVLTRHVLLQENGLATKDPNTEYLLMELNLDKDAVIKTPLYQSLQEKLDGAGLKMAQKKELEIAKKEQRDLVQRLEADKQI